MSQGYFHDAGEIGDQEIRDSIRVIKRQRSAKLVMVILATVVGICVLLLTAYLGFTSS